MSMRTSRLVLPFLATIVLGTVAPLAAAAPASDTVETAAGPLVVRPVGHGTLVLEWNGRAIHVDPVGGAERFAGYPEPDLVLITDIHGDHMDPETVAAIADGATVVAPAAVAESLDDASGYSLSVLANGESIDVEGVTVEAIPMYNLDPERDFHAKGRGNGYVVTLADTRVYISGDTEDIPEMRELEDIDVAFVCMNLPFTMTVDAAADAVLEFKPAIVYPYHYRGRPEMSDVERFESLVAADPDIEVRLLQWY
jgi:L-ascorbate metabolism protein UlaG (beta-lactamase superfamily)